MAKNLIGAAVLLWFAGPSWAEEPVLALVAPREQAATSWYISRVYEHLYCGPDECLQLIISEDQVSGGGAVVYYLSAEVPVLLEAMGASSAPELAGKEVPLARGMEPALRSIVEAGMVCSDRNRRHPLGERYWC